MDEDELRPQGGSPAAVRIETDRLIVRTVAPGDAEAIFEGIGQWEVARMLSHLPWPYTRADAEAYVALADQRDPARNQPFSIVHRSYGLIGGIGFHSQAGVAFPELGYWIAATHWGAGYASEAVAAALAWSETGWRRRTIRACHFVENDASGRVLVKVGMLYTGVVERRMCIPRGEPVAVREMVRLA